MANGVGLKALEHAERLAVLCRRAVDAFPAEERDRLGDQLRRAADSVALNIAEGSAKGSYRDYRRYLDTSRGSLMEAGTAIRIARGAGLIEEALYQEIAECLDETSRTLYGLIRSITARIERGEGRPWPRPRKPPTAGSSPAP